MGCGDPLGQRVARRFSDFELHRALGFLLHDDRAVAHALAMANVTDLEPDEIARAQLAVDCQVEKRELAGAARHLEAYPRCPDFLELEWRFLAGELSLVPGLVRRT